MIRVLRTREILVLSGLAAFAGCEAPPESFTGPEVRSSATAASASGAVLIRGQAATFLVHLDAERELLSVHAPSDVCTTGPLNIADAQFVVTPSAIGQFIAQLKDENEQLAIYRASSFAEAGLSGSFDFAGLGDIVDFTAFCNFLQGPQRVAEGVVRRASVFSNASFTATWTGEIQGVGGEDARLTERYQLGAEAQDPNNPATWVLHVSFINLRTLP